MQEKPGQVVVTYSAADGHKQLAHGLGVIHHDGLHRSVQHLDLLRPLLLLVLEDVLRE